MLQILLDDTDTFLGKQKGTVMGWKNIFTKHISDKRVVLQNIY